MNTRIDQLEEQQVMGASPYVDIAKINLLLEVETKIDFDGRKQINRVKQ